MSNKLINLFKILTPNFIRRIIKSIYKKTIMIYQKMKFLKKGKTVDIGYRFRFSCKDPFSVQIGNKTCLEDFNVWSAKVGDIKVGNMCWFGLNNIVIGPVEIGDKVMTGPYVSIVGPHHAINSYDRTLDNSAKKKPTKTIIGNNVWISTGSIILHGVKIGNNAIISPGSVVTKDVADNAYVSGNPARDVTKLTNFQTKIGKTVRM